MSEAAAATSGKPRWEHFPHAADVGVRGFGRTAAEAFEQAALALTAVVTTADIRPAVSVEVKCEAPDLELLFVEWLNAVIYEMAVRKMLFSRYIVTIDGTRLHGTLWGSRWMLRVTLRPASREAPGAYKDVGAVVGRQPSMRGLRGELRVCAR